MSKAYASFTLDELVPQVSDIPVNVVLYSSQSLTDAQKEQARINIEALNGTAIAPEFSRLETYAVGDIAFSWRTSTFMKCTVAGTGILAEFEDIVLADEKANSTSLAASYDPEKSPGYAIDDYCTYHGVLYRCTTATADPSGAWNAANWTSVAVTDEMGGGGGSSDPTKADATAIAPAFSTSDTYPVGYFVTYNGSLYKCKTAVTTAGAWNASNWELTDCASNFGGGGGGGGGNLPYDAEVQYIESTLNAYIDTGVPANTIVSAYGVFMTPTAGQRFMFGARISSSSGNLAFAWITSMDAFRMSYGTNGNAQQISSNTTSWTNCGFIGTEVFYNGISTSYTQSGSVTNLNAYLFTTNNNGSPIINASIDVPLRLRSFVIETATGRVRDYIAVRKNGVGCLYDRVSKTFFYKPSGVSEDFVIGPDLDMDLYAPKESPAFTGTPTAPDYGSSPATTSQIATINYVQSSARYSIATPTQTITTTTNTDDTLVLTLYDRSINQVSIPSTVTDATISFPTKTAGYARDFFVRLTITGSTVPAITWQEANGDPIDFDVDDDSWEEIEQGVNILMFTETNQASAS